MGHPDCRLCSTLNRAKAYRMLSEPHIIPISHGSRWVGDDLRDAVAQLTPGEFVTINYAGEAEPAPTVTFAMGEDCAVAATVAIPGPMRRQLLQVSFDGTTYPTLVFEVMCALRDARGNRGVVILPPAGPPIGTDPSSTLADDGIA